MNTIQDEYRTTFEEAEQVLKAAFAISVNTQGRKVKDPSSEVGALLFAKLCSHSRAMLTLAPVAPLGCAAPPSMELWDVSSMAVLSRAVIDTYYVFFYLSVEQVGKKVREFRFLVWNYHAENRRLKKLQLIKSQNPQVKEIEERTKELKESIVSNPIYLKQTPNRRKKIRNGDLGIFATNTMLSESAGIKPDYYKATYIHLSSYVHAYPFSLQQLAQFRAGDDGSLLLIKVVIEYCTAFLCLGVRDFLSLWPDQKAVIDADTMRILEVWTGIVRIRKLIKVPSTINWDE